MLTALWIAGAVFSIIVVMVIIGAVLPERHICSRTAVYRQTPDTIWKALERFEQFPSWRTGIARVEPLPDKNGHKVYREHSSEGAITFERVEIITSKRLVGRIADENLPFGGGWTYELCECDGGTRLTISETGAIYNPLFRFMARFIFGYHRTVDGYMRDLARKFGEKIEPATATEASPAGWEVVLPQRSA